jgi:hypothetical protein
MCLGIPNSPHLSGTKRQASVGVLRRGNDEISVEWGRPATIGKCPLFHAGVAVETAVVRRKPAEVLLVLDAEQGSDYASGRGASASDEPERL